VLSLLVSGLCTWLAADGLSLRREAGLIAVSALALVAVVLPRQRRWRDPAPQTSAPATNAQRAAWTAGGLGAVSAALLTPHAKDTLLAVFAGLLLGAVPCYIRNRRII
jgi:hypothetical protein